MDALADAMVHPRTAADPADARIPTPAASSQPRREASTSCIGVRFEDAPLAEVAMRIALLVCERGVIDREQLSEALKEAGVLDVPAGDERLVWRFAWVAKGKRWIDFVDDQWVPGTGQPRRDDRYGDWTYAGIVDRARELLANDNDPFQRLLNEVYHGARVPKLPMSLVRSAISRAKRG